MQSFERKLSKKAIDEFAKLMYEEFGDKLTDEEAEEGAVRLLKFFHLLIWGE